MISIVLERIAAAETVRLGSKTKGQLSAVFGLSGLTAIDKILSVKEMDLIITSDKRHLPTVTKEHSVQIAQKIFDSSVCISHLAWDRTYGEMNQLNLSAAKILAPIYSEILDIIISVDDVRLQLNRIADSIY